MSMLPRVATDKICPYARDMARVAGSLCEADKCMAWEFDVDTYHAETGGRVTSQQDFDAKYKGKAIPTKLRWSEYGDCRRVRNHT